MSETVDTRDISGVEHRIMFTTTERTPVTLDQIKITTVASKRQYRVILRGDHWYSFVKSANQHAGFDTVFIYTKSSNLGGFTIDRFGGELTPAGIRKFITENVRL